PLMDPMLDRFRAALDGIAFHEPQLTVVSNLTGAPAAPGRLASPEYWVRHVRETVRFADGVEALGAAGVVTFVELRPDGVLSGAVGRLADRWESPAAVVPLLRRDRDEAAAVVAALARLYVHGTAVDWRGHFAGSGARAVDLPTYAFQRRRYWPEAAPKATNDP